jgi:hypothetical protein
VACNPSDNVDEPVDEETHVHEVVNKGLNNVAVAPPISCPPVPLKEASVYTILIMFLTLILYIIGMMSFRIYVSYIFFTPVATHGHQPNNNYNTNQILFRFFVNCIFIVRISYYKYL